MIAASEKSKIIAQIKSKFGAQILDIVDQNDNLRVLTPYKDRPTRRNLLIEIAKLLKVKDYVPAAVSLSPKPIKYKPGLSIEVKEGKVGVGGAVAGAPLLKPSNIVPSITGVWIDAATMSRNVIKYLDSQPFDADDREQIKSLVKLVSTNEQTTFRLPNFPVKLVPSEFFEVLSAIKLAKLLSLNDRRIREVLGIPNDLNLSQTKIKINIPIKSNMPLLDYWININDKPNENSSIKISVKSKVSSAKANTVKFADVFEGHDPQSWWNNLTATAKKNNVAQRIISKSVIDSAQGGGVTTRKSQILPLLNLLRSEKKAEIEKVLSNEAQVKPTDIPTLIKMLETLMGKTDQRSDASITTLLQADQLVLAKKMMAASISKTPPPENFAALLYVFDKCVQASSRETSQTKYNFYQMFYDEVLKRQSIAYAVSSYEKGALNIGFYSMINWKQEYNKLWVALRIQSSTMGINSMIGLDV